MQKFHVTKFTLNTNKYERKDVAILVIDSRKIKETLKAQMKNQARFLI